MRPLTAQDAAKLLPTYPLLTSPREGWRGLKMQLYRHPPGTVSSPGNYDHVLVLNTAGRALIDDTTGGRRRRGFAVAGCFSLTPAGYPVIRSWKGRPEVMLIFLDPGLLHGVAQDLGLDATSIDLAPRVAVPDEMVHHFGQLLRHEAENPLWGSALAVDSIAHALSVHLLRQHSSVAAKGGGSRPELTPRRLNRALDYMRAHLERPVTLPELAAICGLSSTHFARAFREAVGKPPHAYLIDLRLQRAVELLENTRLPVTEIALSCGFTQSQYFATAFRRRLGLTPRAWRMRRGM